MEKNEFLSVIKHLHMKGLTLKEIKVELDNVHSTSALVLRSGRSIEVTTPEIIDKVHDIVLTDRRVKVRELVEATGISHGTVISILHEQLGMKKLSAKWVPRLLTVDHKRDRVTISKQCLEMFQRNPDEFLRRFITVDEIWIHSSEKSEDREVDRVDDYYAALLDRFNNILKKKRFSNKKLKNRWIKYIELKGNYVEK
ncbi:SETMR methyltransferase, partial [Acromyrmex charruanus]